MRRPVDDPALLRRRVLSVEAFVEARRAPRRSPDENYRRFGTSVAPVPVPLARGECERQYEEHFLAWLAERGVTLADLVHDTSRERSYRISFAQRIARQHRLRRSEHAARPHASVPRQNRDGTAPSDLPNGQDRRRRELMLFHEYMSLEQFQRDTRSGHFARLNRLGSKDKQKLFGSPYTPIYVPLAPGETAELYEERLVQWLKTTHNTTLRELEAHPIFRQERVLRMQFAAMNARGREEFVAPPSLRACKRDRAESAERDCHTHDNGHAPPVAKKAKKQEGSCLGQDSVEACRTCGCRSCLLRTISLLATKIDALEGKASVCTCSRVGGSEITQVVEPTQCAANKSLPPKRGSSEDHGIAIDIDDIEKRLLEEYEIQNELVVMNESAMTDSAAELVELATSDIAEATRRRDEDDEMRELIHEEVQKRSAALAALLVYMYRSDLPALEAVVNAPEASDVVHVQRVGHLKCKEIAAEIAEPEAQFAEGVEEEGKSRVDAEEKLRTLKARRQGELVTLVHFDAHVRELIRAWLARVQSEN